MKIRIMGLPDEIGRVVELVCATRELDVIEINGPYPNRGNSRMVRVYIETRLTQQAQHPELPS